jgi:hypothetical protein
MPPAFTHSTPPELHLDTVAQRDTAMGAPPGTLPIAQATGDHGRYVLDSLAHDSRLISPSMFHIVFVCLDPATDELWVCSKTWADGDQRLFVVRSVWVRFYDFFFSGNFETEGYRLTFHPRWDTADGNEAYQLIYGCCQHFQISARNVRDLLSDHLGQV